MANEYGRWFVRNDPQTWQQNFGAYQRSFGERYERPEEYTPTVEEYRQYPAMKDILAEQEEKKKKSEQNDASNQSNKIKKRSRTTQNAGRNIGNIIKNIAGKAVAIVGGGVIIVVGYQAIEAEKNAQVVPDKPAPAPIEQVIDTAEMDWISWSADDTTVPVKLFDAEGNLIKELTAVITLTEVAPTCTQEGSKTYTATAEDAGKEYTDTHVESIAPVGHKLDNGTAGTNENGDSVIVYECSECHEKFEVTVTAEEND